MILNSRPDINSAGKLEGKKMFEKVVQNKKGQAGLQLFLSVIVMVFLIAIIIFSLVITGAKLKSSTTDTVAIAVINDTMNDTADAVDWFSIFITIAGVVALIGMIALIIVIIRNSGMLGGQGA